MPLAEKEMLTVEEAAQRVGVEIGRVRYWLRSGELRRYLRGDRRLMVDVDELRKLIERKQRIEPAD